MQRDGTLRAAMAPRLGPLRHRATQAQMQNGLSSIPEESRGSRHEALQLVGFLIIGAETGIRQLGVYRQTSNVISMMP